MNAQTLQKWNKVKLGDVAEIESGGTPSSTKPEYWDGGDICWATLPDLKNKYLFDTQRKITQLGLKNSSAKLLPINSIIFSSRATLGEISITKVDTSTNQGSKNFICNPTKIDYEFLYYLLKSKVEEISNLASGATYKEINKTVFSGVEIDIPSIPVQKQIAQILAVYDDLIYNNIRRIKILEQTAQAIYKEWFVNFRFSGYEKVKKIDSGTEFGKIPEKWKVVIISEAISINPRIKISKTETVPFIAMDRLSETSMVINSSNIERRIGGSGSKFLNSDTLFARITPCLENGKTGYVQFLKDNEVALGSTEFVVLRSKTLTPEFVYCLSRDKAFRDAAAKTMTGASGRQRVQNSFFVNHKIIEPSNDILGIFSDLVTPMFREIKILSEQVNVLKNGRDLLLPKLITGELTISN